MTGDEYAVKSHNVLYSFSPVSEIKWSPIKRTRRYSAPAKGVNIVSFPTTDLDDSSVADAVEVKTRVWKTLDSELEERPELPFREYVAKIVSTMDLEDYRATQYWREFLDDGLITMTPKFRIVRGPIGKDQEK